MDPDGATALGDGEHDADRRAVRDHRRPAVAEKRRDDAGQGNEAEQAGGNHRSLNGQRERGGHCEERGVVARRAQGDSERTPAHERIQGNDGGEAGEAELFADGCQHEIGVRGRNRLRIAETGSGTPGGAGRERPQAVRDLIASGNAVVPGIGPDRHPLPYRRREANLVRRGEAENQHHESGGHKRGTGPRHAVKRQEHAREHEGRTEILLQKEEPEHQGHADRQRPDVLPARQPEVTKPRPRRRRRL